MAIFKILIYTPLYNALVAIIAFVPGHNLGLAIIILTIFVRVVLFPLGHKAAKSQFALKMIEPEINKIKEDFKGNKEEQAKKTFEVYKKHKINPFSGCLMALIQLPIIISLYYVFLSGLQTLDQSSIYSFVSIPDVVNLKFLGITDITSKSLALAILAGVSQFIQAILSPASKTIPKSGNNNSFSDNLSRSLSIQMKYFLPVMIFFFAYQTSAALALYWTISNIFTIAQEMIVKRQINAKHGLLTQ